MKGMSNEAPRPLIQGQSKVRSISIKKEQLFYLRGNGHVTEALFIPEMLEGGDHIGLEIIPAETKLLFLGHLWAEASSVHSLTQCRLGALKILSLTTQLS